ncbi:hypothetical protein CMI37_32380 [Candidatus Pacearchaeota archaeon]|nr:hypothetical protein [Candidatus Pacearchaeota archaeon]|tara:strand:+ start:262 stop:555 length:294 start_codon:yes stop_codon:yes gene_type:complete
MTLGEAKEAIRKWNEEQTAQAGAMAEGMEDVAVRGWEQLSAGPFLLAKDIKEGTFPRENIQAFRDNRDAILAAVRGAIGDDEQRKDKLAAATTKKDK